VPSSFVRVPLLPRPLEQKTSSHPGTFALLEVLEMATPLSDIRSRAPTELPTNVPIVLRFAGVRVHDLTSAEDVEISTRVDLTRYADVEFTFTDRVTGTPKTARGIALHVIEEDGVPVDRFWNLVSKRAIERLKGELATGAYLAYRYRVTAVGEAPKRDYTIERLEPIAPAGSPSS
jgi:hypothetical protein